MIKIFALLLLALLALGTVRAQEAGDPNFLPASQDPARTANGLGMLPPMGWNSWNKFGCAVDDAIVRGAADAMAGNGMRDAGYSYIIIDDCWQGQRDERGDIQPNAAKFRDGMKALVDYVHGKGLKFGIYSDAGSHTCQALPLGSQGHEYQDAAQYARWGVDYVKYDWCLARSRNAEEAYALMADALRATGREMLFAMCEWGLNKPWLWSNKIGNTRRTTGDLGDAWSADFLHQQGMLQVLALNEPLWSYAGPGHYNDADMLQVGNGGMTTAEYRSHFSLWSMMASPLIAGNDLAHMDEATRTILLNAEVIAIDQDKLGVQGRRLSEAGGGEIWVKDLADGGKAWVMFNRGEQPILIGIETEDMGFKDGRKPRVRDVWAHGEVTVSGARFLRTVPPHDVVMLRVSG